MSKATSSIQDYSIQNLSVASLYAEFTVKKKFRPSQYANYIEKSNFHITIVV